MTLISVLNDCGNIIVVSDRAISQRGQFNNILLPSTNNYTISETPVVGYNVKTIIIKEILCIGFSGNVMEIESLISDVKDYFLHRQVYRETLLEIFEDSKDRYKCSVVYLLGAQGANRDQIFVLRSGSWLLNQSSVDFDVLSSGSGARDWTSEILSNLSLLREDSIDTKYSRQRVLLSCITFLAKERITPQLLLDGWGGGFDVVYYDDNKFNRLDNVAYAFYVVDISNTNAILTPISIIHQKYSSGKVIIRHFEKRRSQMYIISEFNNKTSYIEDDPECIAYEVISCVHLFNGEEHLSDLAVLFWDTNLNAEPALFTTRKEGKFGIKFREIYYEKLKEAIEDCIS